MAAQNNGPHQAQQQPAMDNPDMVGSQFVNQYYTVMKSSPKYLHRFYNDNSTFTFVDPGQTGSPAPYTFTARSQKTIHDRVMGLGFDACGVDLFTVDSQFSQNRGVTVLVTGALTFMDGRRRPFVQSFFLAAQERGFYVLNDVFRYLGEAAVGKLQGSQAPSAPARPQEGQENGHPPGSRSSSQTPQEQTSNPPQATPHQPQQQQQPQQPQPNGLPAPPSKPHEAQGGAAAQQAPQSRQAQSQSPPKPRPQAAAAEQVQQGAQSQPSAPGGSQGQNPPTPKEMPVFTAPVAPGQDIPEPHAARPLTQGSSKQPPSPQPAGQEKDEEAPQKPAEPAEAEAEPEAEPPAEGPQPQAQESKSQAPSAPLTYADRLKQGRKDAAAPTPSSTPQQAPQGQSRDVSPAPAGQREASSLHPADSQGSASAQGLSQAPSGRAPSQIPHEEPPNTSIFVRNLPAEVTPEQIEQAFARYGPVKGGPRGVSIKGAKGRDIFAFVEFEEQGGMQAAMEGSTEMEGQRLLVVEKKPWLMNRGGRGFMGRGGGRGDGPRGGFRGRMDSRGPPPGRGRGGFPSDLGGRYQGGRGGRGNEGRGREFGRRGGRDGA